MSRTELIDWEVKENITELFKSDIKIALDDLVQSKLDRDEDRISVFFKKEMIKKLLDLRVNSIVSMLTIGDYDELVKQAKAKINLSTTIQELDRQIELQVEEDGLETIIPNFSL